MDDNTNPYKPPKNQNSPPITPAFSDADDMPGFSGLPPFWGIVWGLTKIGCFIGLVVIVIGGRVLWRFLHH
jgi:hypothetical protein